MQAELAELKEKIKKREELIQCLGSNIDELDVKKSVLIIENNKLRALLKGCQEVLSNICEENDWNSEYSTPLDVWDIMIRINEVLK